MNKTRLFNIIACLVFLVILKFDVLAQPANVGIGTNNPDESAILDLFSNSKGILFPRLTTAARDAISNPATGLLIFNSDDKLFQFNAGTPLIPDWVTLEYDFTGLGLADGTIFVGNDQNLPISRTLSGDATLSNTGELHINLTGNTTGDLMYFDGNNWVRLAPGTDGYLLKSNGALSAPSWTAGNFVTSVALTVPSQFSVTGSPITDNGTLAISWENQSANKVFAGPSTGVDAAPTFRSLELSDLPFSIPTTKITGVAANRLLVTGTAGGAITESAVMTNGQLLIGNTGNAPTVASLTGGTGINISNGAGTITISATTSLPNSTVDNSTLRWNDATSEWQVNSLVKTSSAKLIVGDAGTSGSLEVSDGSNNTATIIAPGLTSNVIDTIPNIGVNSSFVMTQGAQHIAGIKSFANAIEVRNQNELRLYEGSGGGTNYSSFKSSAIMAANVNYTLPSADGVDNSVLMTDGAGGLSWGVGIFPSRDLTGNYTATVNDFAIFNKTGSDYTVTLPTASSNTGKVFFIKRVGSGDVTVNNVDGQNITLNNTYESLLVISNGSSWSIIARINI